LFTNLFTSQFNSIKTVACQSAYIIHMPGPKPSCSLGGGVVYYKPMTGTFANRDIETVI